MFAVLPALCVQLVAALVAGVVIHRTLFFSEWLRLAIHLLVAAVFIYSQSFLAASEPRYGATDEHIYSFLLGGSAFLCTTRILYFAVVGPKHAAITRRRDWESLPFFLCLFFLAPVSLKSLKATEAEKQHTKWVLVRALTKLFALIAIILYVLIPYQHAISSSLALFSATANVLLYLFASGIEDMVAFALEAALSVHMWPSFDAPWMAATSSEFWGQRWHIPFRDCLVQVYQQLRKGGVPKAACVLFVFTYSGLCHVAQFWLITRRISIELFGFFIFAGAMMIVEHVLFPRLQRTWGMTSSRVVQRIFVVGGLGVASQFFWLSLYNMRYLQALASLAQRTTSYLLS